MAYKLAIAPVVEFEVELAFDDAGQRREAELTLLGRRSQADELQSQPVREQTVRDFLLDRLTGWRDQTLVLDADSDKPAAFSRDALACLLSLPGAADVVLARYLRAISAEGKRKN